MGKNKMTGIYELDGYKMPHDLQIPYEATTSVIENRKTAPILRKSKQTQTQNAIIIQCD